MTRVVLLSMSESEVIAKCHDAKIGVSAIERLTTGGVRLVCMSVDGAATIRFSVEPDSPFCAKSSFLHL